MVGCRCERFPAIGGDCGTGTGGRKKALTTLAAADSRHRSLLPFSFQQSSLPFQNINNLNQDESDSWRKKTEDQWVWSLQSTHKHGGGGGEWTFDYNWSTNTFPFHELQADDWWPHAFLLYIKEATRFHVGLTGGILLFLPRSIDKNIRNKKTSVTYNIH